MKTYEFAHKIVLKFKKRFPLEFNEYLLDDRKYLLDLIRTKTSLLGKLSDKVMISVEEVLGEYAQERAEMMREKKEEEESKGKSKNIDEWHRFRRFSRYRRPSYYKPRRDPDEMNLGDDDHYISNQIFVKTDSYGHEIGIDKQATQLHNSKMAQQMDDDARNLVEKYVLKHKGIFNNLWSRVKAGTATVDGLKASAVRYLKKKAAQETETINYEQELMAGEMIDKLLKGEKINEEWQGRKWHGKKKFKKHFNKKQEIFNKRDREMEEAGTAPNVGVGGHFKNESDSLNESIFVELVEFSKRIPEFDDVAYIKVAHRGRWRRLENRAEIQDAVRYYGTRQNLFDLNVRTIATAEEANEFVKSVEAEGEIHTFERKPKGIIQSEPELAYDALHRFDESIEAAYDSAKYFGKMNNLLKMDKDTQDRIKQIARTIKLVEGLGFSGSRLKKKDRKQPECPHCGAQGQKTDGLVWRNSSDQIQCDNCGYEETDENQGEDK